MNVNDVVCVLLLFLIFLLDVNVLSLSASLSLLLHAFLFCFFLRPVVTLFFVKLLFLPKLSCHCRACC